MKLLCDRQRFGARKLFRGVHSTGDQYSGVEDSHLRDIAHQLGDPEGVLQPLGTQSGDARQLGQTRRDKVPNPMNAHGPKPSDCLGAQSGNRIDKTLLGQIVSLSMALMHHGLDPLRNLRIFLLSQPVKLTIDFAVVGRRRAGVLNHRRTIQDRMEPQIGVRIDDVLRLGVAQILMHPRHGTTVASDTSCDKLVSGRQQQLPPISRKVRNDMEDLLQRFASETIERILKHKRNASDPRSCRLCQGQANR